ncbi:hypothetical protein QNA24_29955 [Rhodococcus qingshengii]|uniref:hypothetical protein n=1 Tax=Rhodococcus TaxID=1827 RepID=UPI001E61623B|nr:MULTISPECIES: hypothetical protein [Rhodococcus]MCD2099594.1 hypothetical protein [Rhodococcus rhodochrous]MCD2123962.1 hypothetical protein [Rhodococcus rhodochrous]MCQ4136607.1 hypothetical protein [Rhodococcus rhodochrous]MDJ0490608.1 hypothetical protein [Rhodococcus qingshengii]
MSNPAAVEAARWVLDSPDRAWMMRHYQDLVHRPVDGWGDPDYKAADEWLIAKYAELNEAAA